MSFDVQISVSKNLHNCALISNQQNSTENFLKCLSVVIILKFGTNKILYVFFKIFFDINFLSIWGIIVNKSYLFSPMLLHKACRYVWSIPGGLDSKESVCNAGDPGLTPGLEKFHGEGNGSQLQYSCLENFMDRGAWWLQSMWSQRIRRDWVTNTALAYQEAAHLSFERVIPQHPNNHNRLTIHLCPCLE